jgi:hypothetical protein
MEASLKGERSRRRRLSDLAWTLAKATQREHIERLALEGVHQLIDGELSGINVVDLRTGATRVTHFPEDPLDIDLNAAVTATISEHPAYRHFMDKGDLTPFKISDMYPSLLQFKKTRVYAEIFAPNRLGTPSNEHYTGAYYNGWLPYNGHIRGHQ